MAVQHRIFHHASLWWYVAHVTQTDAGWVMQIWEYTDVEDDRCGDGTGFVHLPWAKEKIGADAPLKTAPTLRNYRGVFTRALAKRGWAIRTGSHPVWVTRRNRYEVALALPPIIPTADRELNGLAVRVAARLGINTIIDANTFTITDRRRQVSDVVAGWPTRTVPAHHGDTDNERSHHGETERHAVDRQGSHG